MSISVTKAAIDNLPDDVIEEIKIANGYCDWTNQEFREYWKSKLS